MPADRGVGPANRRNQTPQQKQSDTSTRPLVPLRAKPFATGPSVSYHAGCYKMPSRGTRRIRGG